jgi:predicted nucleotidyltransferase component of viral defense system
MLVMNESGMAAGKLSALLSRKKIAARDLYDLWFFLKKNWKIDETILMNKTHLELLPAIHKAQNIVKDVKKSELLSGLGDLLNVAQRNWVRDKLTDELIFLLRLYEESLSKDSEVK